MTGPRIDAVWIEEHHLSIDDLDEHWGLSSSQLRELIAHGVLEPRAWAPQVSFSIDDVTTVLTACRLQQELELDTHAVGVVLDLLRRMQGLQDELASLRARLPAESTVDDEPPEAEVIAPARS